MLLMKLLDIYNKINSCPRKMGSLQVLCALGDAHRQGAQWVPVSDLQETVECDTANVRHAIKQMLDQNLIERAYIDIDGAMTEKRTKKPVVRLFGECQEALGI